MLSQFVLPSQASESMGLGTPLPWPVVWSYLELWLFTRCQWASVRWPVCQLHESRSKLQETSRGGVELGGGQHYPLPPSQL